MTVVPVNRVPVLALRVTTGTKSPARGFVAGGGHYTDNTQTLTARGMLTVLQ